MAQQHIDTLIKLRAKLVSQRRDMATRQSGASQGENYDRIVTLQAAIEATDRAIADEERLWAATPAPGT
jgi:hypothetical protein